MYCRSTLIVDGVVLILKAFFEIVNFTLKMYNIMEIINLTHI